MSDEVVECDADLFLSELHDSKVDGGHMRQRLDVPHLGGLLAHILILLQLLFLLLRQLLYREPS